MQELDEELNTLVNEDVATMMSSLNIPSGPVPAIDPRVAQPSGGGLSFRCLILLRVAQ